MRRSNLFSSLLISLVVVVGAVAVSPAGATTANQAGRRAAAPEATLQQKDSIFRLYQAYFLRAPDAGGWTHWANTYVKGGSLAKISNVFAGSSEFKNRYGDLSNAGFVDLIYKNVFYRQADPPGSRYWTSVLDGGRSRGLVMIGFSESPEFIKLTATLPPK
ncbi:MAG: DUF4214 domain-containing protein [Aquihabitans sp.]